MANKPLPKLTIDPADTENNDWLRSPEAKQAAAKERARAKRAAKTPPKNKNFGA